PPVEEFDVPPLGLPPLAPCALVAPAASPPVFACPPEALPPVLCAPPWLNPPAPPSTAEVPPRGPLPELPPTPPMPPPSPPEPPVPPGSPVPDPMNFHQLKLRRLPEPPVNTKNRSCTALAPLMAHVWVAQVCVPPVPAIAHVPTSLPV